MENLLGLLRPGGFGRLRLQHDGQRPLLGHESRFLESNQPAQRSQRLAARHLDQPQHHGAPLAQVLRVVVGQRFFHQRRVGLVNPIDADEVNEIASAGGDFQIIVFLSRHKHVERFRPELGQFLLGLLTDSILRIAQLVDERSRALGGGWGG